MKFLFFILFSSVFPLLCFLPKEPANLSNNLSNQPEILLNYEVKREQYKKYKSTQRLKYWKQRINQADKLTLLTSAQKDLCTKIEQTLTIAFFENPSNYNLDSLTNKAISVLGKEKTAYLFASMAISQEEYDLIQQSQTKPNCGCSTKSDFCSGVLKCVASDQCSTTSAGCGFLFFYSCTGNCK